MNKKYFERVKVGSDGCLKAKIKSADVPLLLGMGLEEGLPMPRGDVLQGLPLSAFPSRPTVSQSVDPAVLPLWPHIRGGGSRWKKR